MVLEAKADHEGPGFICPWCARAAGVITIVSLCVCLLQHYIATTSESEGF